MVRLFVVLGFALLAGGAYAIVDGWPYRVLESGFTEVILGGLSLAAGLILLALAAVLAELRRLKGLVSGAMAAVALSEPRSGERQMPSEAPARPEPAFDKAPEPTAGHVGMATTLAAGAGAAVVAGALAGLAKSEDAPDAKATDRANETGKAEEGDDTRSDRVETVAAEPSQAPPAATGDIDDWLLPPVSPVLDVAPADVRSDEPDGEGEVAMESEDTREIPEGPASVDADEPADPEIPEIAKPAAIVADEPEAKQAQEERDEAVKPHVAPATSAEDRLWWPRIERPTREEPASIDDEFNALRDQLSGVVNAPEVEPPRRDHDVLGSAESWIAARPWPPVTQPRDPGALSEVEADAADKARPEEAKAEPAPLADEPSPSEPAAEPALAAEDAWPAEKAEPSAAEAKSNEAKSNEAKSNDAEPAEAKPDDEPAASEEGVIGAYQVGETQFTMFADGSIHARTPDGDYVFASMDELKAYLASEKDKLETSSS
ncbi:hypothetical protein ACFPOB_05450 [Bosea eneae]|uniref:Uncharacterized protein n=1 Tax=Bosea eneae TaxID=151454 RepID=A0ABW0IN11_9HYPH